MSRSERYDAKSNRRLVAALLTFSFLMVCVLGGAWAALESMPVLSITLLALTPAIFSFGCHLGRCARYWSVRADAERPFSTKENLSSPRWHGAPTTKNNDN